MLTNGTKREVDPMVQILSRRCLEFRRAACKRPWTNKNKPLRIMKLYDKKWPEGAGWHYKKQAYNEDGDGTYIEPFCMISCFVEASWQHFWVS